MHKADSTLGVFDFGNLVLQSNNATQVSLALGGTSVFPGGQRW
jgi:hypothetical protein